MMKNYKLISICVILFLFCVICGYTQSSKDSSSNQATTTTQTLTPLMPIPLDDSIPRIISKLPSPTYFSFYNLLSNASFESWTDTVLDGWSYEGLISQSTDKYLDVFSVTLTDLSSISQSLIDYNHLKDKDIVFGCWVKATAPNQTRLLIDDGIEQKYSIYHTGSGSWEFLTVTKTIKSDATKLTLKIINEQEATTTLIDAACLYEVTKDNNICFTPNPSDNIQMPANLIYTDLEYKKVGIGLIPDTQKDYKLDVAGSLNALDIYLDNSPLGLWKRINDTEIYFDGQKVGIGMPPVTNALEVSGNVKANKFLLFDDTELTAGLWSKKEGTEDIYYNLGNVGIGTTAPGTKLYVSGGDISIDSGQYYRQKDASGTNRCVIGFNSSDVLEILNNTGGDGGPIIFENKNGAIESMRIDTNGNVGIGTTEPGAKLEVFQTGASEGELKIKTASLSPNYAALVLDDSSAGGENAGDIIYKKNGINTFLLRMADDSYGGTIDFQERKTTPGVSRLYIKGNGSIGIGTVSPASILCLNQTDNPYLTFKIGDTTKWRIGAESASGRGFIIHEDGVDYRFCISPGGNVWISGNVGIGRVDPGNARLNVKGSTSDSAAWSLWAADSGGTQLFGVRNDGNVGIGTAGPTAGLDVATSKRILGILKTSTIPQSSFYDESFAINNDGGGAGGFIYNSGISGTFPLNWYGEVIIQGNPRSGYNDGISFVTGTGTSQAVRMRVQSDGNVGIGTTEPGKKLDIKGSVADVAQLRILSNDYAEGVGESGHFKADNGGLTIEATDTGWTNWGDIFLAPNGGRVYVGGTSITDPEEFNVIGDIKVSGNINAKYQDVAEWVESCEALSPGTVVVIDPSADNRVLTSSSAYDTKVCGVVSHQPGLSLGEKAEGRYQIAHTGRVKVKADASFGKISRGDLLVTGSKPGVAMKCQAKNYTPGAVLGKALEPLDEGEGEILVLLSLQ